MRGRICVSICYSPIGNTMQWAQTILSCRTICAWPGLLYLLTYLLKLLYLRPCCTCSSGVELIQFAVPDNYHPVCEYDTVNFMLDATITERFDGLFHTFILYCERILAETDLLARLRYFHVLRASLAVWAFLTVTHHAQSYRTKSRELGFDNEFRGAIRYEM